MTIVKDKIFTKNLKSILRYIALDSKIRAQNFNIALSKKINTLPNHPYKYRKSFYYDSEEVRDFTFKGYTIPYLIDNNKEVIVLSDIDIDLNKKLKEINDELTKALTVEAAKIKKERENKGGKSNSDKSTDTPSNTQTK